MAGLTGSWRALRLLIFLSLLNLTGQFEVREDEWEELGPDIAALHRLPGLSEQMFREIIPQPRTQRDTSIHQTRVKRSSERMDLGEKLMSSHKAFKKCERSFPSCVIQAKQNLADFLTAIEELKTQDWLFGASEISHSYSQKFLIMTDEKGATDDRVQEEYSKDPYYSVIVSKDCLNNASCLPEADGYTVVKVFGSVSDDGQSVSGLSGSSLAELMMKPSLSRVPVFSLDGNTTSDFHYNFIRVLTMRGHRAVLETNKGSEQVYKVIKEPDTMYSRKIPQRKVDHTTQYDHQQIIMLQDEPRVRAAAAALYDKHPSVSSVYILDDNRKPKLIFGDPAPLSENSRLTLVGHGKADTTGESRMGELTASDLEKVIEQTYRVGDEIKTINIVGCDVGSDKKFAETLLKELHENAGIKTELHLRDTVLQVKHTGEKITQEITADGIRWRHKDDSKKVVATLDKKGEVIIREESGSKGEAVFTDERNFLGGGESRPDGWDRKPLPRRFRKFRNDQPNMPKDFIDSRVYEEFNNPDQVRSASHEIQAMAWEMIHNQPPPLRKVDTKNLKIEGQYEMGIKIKLEKRKEIDQSNVEEIRWDATEEEKKFMLSQCYEIKSVEDVRSIIHHFSTKGENWPAYLMIKDWIVVVDPQSLYVYLIGKKLDNNQIEQGAGSQIRDAIDEQIGKEKYPDIKENILGKRKRKMTSQEYEAYQAKKMKYADFVKDVFVPEHITSNTISEEAWHTSYFAASVISESARNSRTFPLILMALDMIQSNDNNARERGLNFLFEDHSMTFGGSWIDPGSRGHSGSTTPKGSTKLTNYQPQTEGQLMNSLKSVVETEVKFYNFGSAKIGEDGKSRILNMAHKSNEDAELISKHYKDFKKTLKEISTARTSTDRSNTQASGSLGGHDDTHVTSQDLKSATQLENSFKLESYYSRARALVSEQIQNHIQAKYGENQMKLKVQEGSARIENGEFLCHLVSEGAEPVELRIPLSPDSQHYNEKMNQMMETAIHDMEKHASVPSHEGSNLVEHAGTAVGALGLMLGMKGAVRAFEQGDIKDGVVGALQTAHGVTAMTTSVIARQTLSSEARIAKAASTIMRSPVMKGAMVALPIVGIGFGLYNFAQDLERGDTLGYIDAAFDGTMVALDVVELAVPELAPFIIPINLALSTVRMVFDDIFMGIQDELNSLPPDAGILQKLLAVSLGFEEGIINFGIHVLSIVFDFRYDEIRQGKKLVEQMSDYHQYYKVITQDDGSQAVDFTGGSSSWNGGGVHFVLADHGSSELCMDYFVSSDESMRKRCWTIDSRGSNDIILGIGEANQLEYKELQMKLFMFIPVGSVTVVSGRKAITSSRYGVYTGNRNANRFFAVQKANDAHTLEVMLSYYYRLFGEPGDDIFFLGPQKSYVRGAGGQDTYVIPENGGKTIIDNYDPAKAQDTLHFSVAYDHISVSKSGDNVVLMYEGSHMVVIQGWFLGDAYQHINMLSGDGVIFEISSTVISSVQLVARGINKMYQTQGVTVNTLEPLYKTVTNIVGSKFNDILIGNGERNVLEGGGGRDFMKGGEGEDMYIVKSNGQSLVVIDNHSNDLKTDVVTIEANLHSLRVRVEQQNLVLHASQGNSAISVTLKGWFSSPANRHLFIITKDMVTLKPTENRADCLNGDPLRKCLKSSSIDFSRSSSALVIDLEADDALDSVTEIRGSRMNDVIKGNKEHNVFVPGQGNDYLEGRGGEDWYVITPDQGVKTINNQSPDLALDFLFFQESYPNLQCFCEGQNIIISVRWSRVVVLQNWFVSKNYQHLQIKTRDGITAELITNRAKCRESVILPITVDFTSQTPRPLAPYIEQFLRWLTHEGYKPPVRYHLHHMGRKIDAVRDFFRSRGKMMLAHNADSVKQMYGSSGFDLMVGNSNDNLLDPHTGGALMVGGEGKDTYRIKHKYGKRIMINNYAEDNTTDTVLVDMDFLTGSTVTLESVDSDLSLTIMTKEEELGIKLLKYNDGFKHQHIEFLSSDGVHFKLKSLNSTGNVPSFEIEAFKVTLKTSQVDCRLDLGSQRNLSNVHTVQGCPSLSNDIFGNDQDNALIGGWKDDALEGGDGKDTLIGGAGNDILIGGSGDDTLYGEDGSDTMMGNSGSDVFYPGPGADLVDGGPGRDTVLYRGDHNTGQGVYVNLLIGQGRFADAEGDVLKDVETIVGTIYSDLLVSGYESCLLKGSDGDDILVSIGDDYLVGGDGKDIYMLAFNYGAVTINNCAKDNAIDVVYLNSELPPTTDHQVLPDGVLLTLRGQDQKAVEIFLVGWVNNDHECGHLKFIFRDVEVSVDRLLNGRS